MKSLLLTLGMWTASLLATAQVNYGNLAPLHVEGNQFKDMHGNTVVMHGVMDTPSMWFQGYIDANGHHSYWSGGYNSTGAADCKRYNSKLFTALTDTAQGAFCDIFRLHLEPAWTNGSEGSWTVDSREEVSDHGTEAYFGKYTPANLDKWLKDLYFPLAADAMKHGMYVIMRPPGVCPPNIYVGGSYQKYLLDVWDRVSKNDSIRKYSGQIMIELANEPINVLMNNGSSSSMALHDFFQPIADKIRSNGFTGIILVPGTGYQSNYRDYATYPITGYNIGYAVHVYSGWYGNINDSNCNANTFINNFGEAVPVVKTNPIVVTEVDWSPQNTSGEIDHYNEMGQPVYKNYGTWATGSTSKWGKAFKAVLDHYGNISMTLTHPHDFFDINTYLSTGKVVPAFKAAMEANGLDVYEASSGACFQWYKEYYFKDYAGKAYSRTWTADQGNGKYLNPLINADFPDVDVIRVDDTFYMVSTTMYHFPGATILKSKDLVNWEYCANPLQQIDSSDAYDLLNGQDHYAQGQWAASLNYHDGKFYVYFICYGKQGVDETQNILLTAENPEGKWTMTKMADHYYDSGWLFDDGENGDGYLYVACGINHIWVNKLDPKTLNKLSSTEVIAQEDTGLEGTHMYHIGDYYYLYCTYNHGDDVTYFGPSQTIFRSTNPMGPYEECSKRVFYNQYIHQGALVDTQTGEWWTILFKDAGPLGRLPYLEPVKWTDGWPTIGRNGIDVSKNGRPYKMPDVGASHPRTYLPTNDTFTGVGLAPQWQWNHNPDNAAWSMMERPGYMRLYTANVTEYLHSARNSLTQRIFGYSPENTAANKYVDSYGTVKMDISHMQEGDVAGLAVFQNPYSFISVKMENGQKRLFSQRCTFDNHVHAVAETLYGNVIDADTIYFRAVTNFGSNVNTCKFYYSLDNATWTSFGVTMTMRYTLDYFVGQRFYLFNYATQATGGYVDIDWFSTEPVYTEERFYAPGTLKTYTEEDLIIQKLSIENTTQNVLTGGVKTFNITSVAKSGYTQDVTTSCTYVCDNPEVATVSGGRIIGLNEGECNVTATYTDLKKEVHTLEFKVNVTYFPLTNEGFNPNIYATGSFDEKTGKLVTGQYGFGGWYYSKGIDISAYKYIVVKLKSNAVNGLSFRLFDENSYWAGANENNVSGTKLSVNLKTARKKKDNKDIGALDPSHIYYVGFWTYGGQANYIDKVFLSNDGVNPATGIEPIFVADDATGEPRNATHYAVDGRVIPADQPGIHIIRYSDGTTRKVFVK